MVNTLLKYLYLHNNLSIPGVGQFMLHRSAAQYSTDRVIPPQQTLVFEPGTAITDKNFYQFAAKEAGIDEVQAVRKFQDFAYQLRKDIQSSPSVEIAGLGVLQRGMAGEVAFEPSINIHKYFPGIPLPVIEEASNIPPTGPSETLVETAAVVEPEEPAPGKDRWWVWALILAAIALAAITYQYLTGAGL